MRERESVCGVCVLMEFFEESRPSSWKSHANIIVYSRPYGWLCWMMVTLNLALVVCVRVFFGSVSWHKTEPWLDPVPGTDSTVIDIIMEISCSGNVSGLLPSWRSGSSLLSQSSGLFAVWRMPPMAIDRVLGVSFVLEKPIVRIPCDHHLSRISTVLLLRRSFGRDRGSL